MRGRRIIAIIMSGDLHLFRVMLLLLHLARPILLFRKLYRLLQRSGSSPFLLPSSSRTLLRTKVELERRRIPQLIIIIIIIIDRGHPHRAIIGNIAAIMVVEVGGMNGRTDITTNTITTNINATRRDSNGRSDRRRPRQGALRLLRWRLLPSTNRSSSSSNCGRSRLLLILPDQHHGVRRFDRRCSCSCCCCRIRRGGGGDCPESGSQSVG
mmetsp:Transcript_17206/g.48378  ORF Transcript_17206/g.48378 Transcript_17206/m.48378 type:complete len:211 (+) Transcript_17206:1770-2402(+)